MLGLCTLAAALGSGAAYAAPGHNHGDAPTLTTGDAPRRLPSGEVFLPKPSQRKLAVRTFIASAGEHPRAFDLNGRVVADPNAGGQVQSTQAGRLMAGPNGLPALGAQVRRGDVLAYLEPSIGAIERSNQEALVADLKAQHESARQRLARLEQLEGAVPAKDIENARLDVRSLAVRGGVASAGLSARETLRAPVAGVISVAGVVAGQVIDARQVVYQIVDPKRLMIEALAYSDDQTAGIVSAAFRAADGTSVKLALIGAGAQLRDQALPLMFRIDGQVALAVNQPVRITAQSATRIKGVAVPSTALARNASNETIVWIHTEAETFAPRVVRSVPLDGARVAVVAGLVGGERVVAEGAQLLGQVR